MSSLKIEVVLSEADLAQTLGRQWPFEVKAETVAKALGHAEVAKYLLVYGIRQQADAGAGAKSAGEFAERLSARFEALAEGNVPKGGGGGPRLDPVIEEYIRLVHVALGCTKTQLREWAKDDGRDPVKLAMRIAVRRKGKAATQAMAQRIADGLMAKARAAVEARADDVDDLLEE